MRDGSVFNRKLTRREFIKKGVIGVGGVALGAYTINNFFLKGNPTGFSLAFRDAAPSKLWKWSREADYYSRRGNSVQCQLCPHRCVLGREDRGFCRTRVNKGNKLYTIAYGNPCSVHLDPIEKKPLFHFLPTTGVLSIATAGCSLRCLNCQNWEISQAKPEDTRNYDLMPGKLVKVAEQKKVRSIAYTYSEPNAFYEYMLDSAQLAAQRGIKNVAVTAGYINEKPLRKVCRYLDAANVDLKGFTNSFYQKVCSGTLEPVLRSLKTMKQEKVWLEITNLIVPNYSDDLEKIRQMCRWIYQNIGDEQPLHFSRFSPYYKLTHLPPTPVKTLEQARKIAMEEGLKFVYVGNVPGHQAQHTYCPNCGALCISRKGYSAEMTNFENGACQKCGEKIPGVWKL